MTTNEATEAMDGRFGRYVLSGQCLCNGCLFRREYRDEDGADPDRDCHQQEEERCGRVRAGGLPDIRWNALRGHDRVFVGIFIIAALPERARRAKAHARAVFAATEL